MTITIFHQYDLLTFAMHSPGKWDTNFSSSELSFVNVHFEGKQCIWKTLTNITAIRSSLKLIITIICIQFNSEHEQPLTQCLESTCLNGGYCSGSIDAPKCTCPEGTRGKTCDRSKMTALSGFYSCTAFIYKTKTPYHIHAFHIFR